MIRSSIVLSALFALALALPAQQREEAVASWSEGKAVVKYGAPAWNDGFEKAMKTEKVWRLGSNQPTELHLECGLMTNDGPIPPGDYKLAMRRNPENVWQLVVYQGSGQYAAGAPGFGINPSEHMNASDQAAERLTININDQKHMSVRFGPHTMVYALMPVAMHQKFSTEFNGIPTHIQTMAVATEGPIKDLAVGQASVEISDMATGKSMTMNWDMKLTIDGDTATLALHNTRAAGIDGDIANVKSEIKRIEGRMAEVDNESMKERLAAAIKTRTETIAALEAEKSMLSRYKSEGTIKGKVVPMDAATKTLTFEAERVQGGCDLQFGAGNGKAMFNLNPREFRAARR